MSNTGSAAVSAAPELTLSLFHRDDVSQSSPRHTAYPVKNRPASLDIRVPIHDRHDIVSARRSGRRLALQMGCSGSQIALVLTAISELARNIIMYARTGEIILSRVTTDQGEAMMVVANDRGPGIADIPAALRRGPTETGSSGLGLSGLEQVMDGFSIDSKPGAGTRVTCEVVTN